jgi:hypothetical protein
MVFECVGANEDVEGEWESTEESRSLCGAGMCSMFAHFSLRLLAHRKHHPRLGLPSTIHEPDHPEVGEPKFVRIRREWRYGGQCVAETMVGGVGERGGRWDRAGFELGRGVDAGAGEEGGHRAGTSAAGVGQGKSMCMCMCGWCQ